jgi:hypothetical protein
MRTPRPPTVVLILSRSPLSEARRIVSASRQLPETWTGGVAVFMRPRHTAHTLQYGYALGCAEVLSGHFPKKNR